MGRSLFNPFSISLAFFPDLENLQRSLGSAQLPPAPSQALPAVHALLGPMDPSTHNQSTVTNLGCPHENGPLQNAGPSTVFVDLVVLR
mmetsp:Transcript_49388/g.88243  ORF Transcript_49388/g.88243 Transcript_49388/m.88243 type:complete len:88 (+) Transcript_49388:2039-2302(+)